MKDSTKQVIKNIGDFALDMLEGFTYSLERTSRSHARNRTLSAEHRQKYSEMSENLSAFREAIHSHRKNDNNPEVYFCDEDEVEANVGYSSECNKVKPEPHIPVVYDDEEKCNQQALSATSDFDLGSLTFDQWDTKWINCGALIHHTLEDCFDIGLVRFRIYSEPVYITRAIELNHKGISKKLHDILSNNAKKSAIQKKINDNLSILEVDILVVGNDESAISFARALEIAMIQKYNPVWLRRE